LCLELAERCPEIPFTMILNRRYADVFDEVQRRRPANVRIVERVPHAEIGQYFRRARALVSTSSAVWEGFPNTFLQAGAAGAVVLSLEVDPDGLLARHGCGLAAGGSLDRLAGDLRRVWSDAPLAASLAARMRAYIESYHALDGRIAELEAMLRSLRP
jgi:glycosyltransferase involved in cell wall biosynthesis